MTLRSGNLRDGLPLPGSAEAVTPLAGLNGVRIERIVSRGHASGEGFWYDQDEREYVLVVSGNAELAFEPGGTLRLAAGDWVDIPAHHRHRVLWTDPSVDTIWLAVFYSR